MSGWREQITYDPIEPLINSKWKAIRYFTRRDLLGEDVGPVAVLWELREPMRLLRGQRDDGSWAYPGKYPEKYPDVNYSLLETFKRLRLLVSKYGFNRSHRTIQVQLSYSSVGPEERRSLRD